MNVQILAGTYIDCAIWVDGRLLAGTSDGATFHCYLEPALVNPQPIWSQTASENLLWTRCAVQGGKFVSVSQGQQGTAWRVGEGDVKALGPTLGTQPVAIDAHEAYVVDRQGFYTRYGFVPQSYPFPPGLPASSSQGLLDAYQGELSWADIDRTTVIRGVTFTNPNVRRLPVAPFTEVTVGQVNGGIAAAVGGKVTLVIPGALASEGHLDISWTGRVAICARTDRGAAYVATTIQELSA